MYFAWKPQSIYPLVNYFHILFCRFIFTYLLFIVLSNDNNNNVLHKILLVQFIMSYTKKGTDNNLFHNELFNVHTHSEKECPTAFLYNCEMKREKRNNNNISNIFTSWTIRFTKSNLKWTNKQKHISNDQDHVIKNSLHNSKIIDTQRAILSICHTGQNHLQCRKKLRYFHTPCICTKQSKRQMFFFYFLWFDEKNGNFELLHFNFDIWRDYFVEIILLI